MTGRQNQDAVSSDSGMTLLELMVVLAIVSMALLLVMPNLRGPARSVEVRTAAQDLISHLRAARASAIARGGTVAVDFDLARQSYRVGSAATPVRLPRDLSITLTTGRQLTGEGGAARMLFFADGSASGGRIVLARDRTRTAVGVDWLTGFAALEAMP